MNFVNLLSEVSETLPFRRAMDLLDIFLVSFIIYKILQVIRGTRAAQMLLGLGILVMAYFVARWASLNTTYWLLQTFLGYIVFAVIVLFQTEIRRGLAQVGQRTFIGSIYSISMEQTIDEVVRAAVHLSERRLGALMVLEKNMDLKNAVESGVDIDGKVSHELLASIFYPPSPLHDGAIIVRGDRVLKAACFLPMTLRDDVGTELGSRHRSAIGLTEDTDAVVVVISEETGVISVAFSGQLSREHNVDTLKQTLQGLFKITKVEKTFRKKRALKLTATLKKEAPEIKDNSGEFLKPNSE